MNEMYNSQNENQYQDYQQVTQPTVQEQLQYQYQEPQNELEEPVTMGEWMITLLIMMIPLVNIVMAFVWAFSSKEKKSKSNYFKAFLIFLAIQVVLCIILFVVMGAIFAATMSQMRTF